jgi:hypothetical protein
MGGGLPPTDRPVLSGADNSTPLHLRTTTGEVRIRLHHSPAGAPWRNRLMLPPKQVVVCDFVVSATGVGAQNTAFLHSSTAEDVVQAGMSGVGGPTSAAAAAAISLQCTEEGYISTDSVMRTSICDVYAAGDCCQFNALCSTGQSVAPARASYHFFQMRLWTQVGEEVTAPSIFFWCVMFGS